MKNVSVTIVTVVFLVAAIMTVGGYFSTATEAQRSVNSRYDYAVINGSYQPYPSDGPSSVSAAVNVCYLQTSGCQNEEVRVEINLSKFLQDERLENAPNTRQLAASRASNVAFARAISKLGADGWEMVEAPEIEFDLYYTNPQGIQTVKQGQQTNRKHIWFKRVRQ